MRKKEIYWLFGTIAFILILNFILNGKKGFDTGSAIDINVHDTYYVISNFHFILIISVFTFFVIYLIRTLKMKFKNLTVNLILMISIILLSLILNGINMMLDSFIQQSSGWTIYPPLSADAVEHNFGNDRNIFEILSYFILPFQILILVLLGYCGFKTGRNFIKGE